MTFDSGTPDQFARAATLIRATDAEERAIHVLGDLIEIAKMQADQRAIARDRLTNFAFDPSSLAGAIPLYRRTDPETCRTIQLRYHQLLAEIAEAYGPGTKPRKIDFHGLNPPEARAYLLAPYLDLMVGGAFPRLDLDRSDPARGHLVYTHTGGPADPAQWRPHLARISAWLGANFQIGDHTATTVTLIRRPQLPAVIPMDRRWIAPGKLFLGIDIETQRPAHLPLTAMPSGTLVVGRAGSGKSNATHVLMQSVLASLHLYQAVFLIDGKQGHTFRRYRTTAPEKIRVLTEEADAWRLMRQLAPVIEARNATLAEKGLETAPNSFIGVFIEEMSAYTAKPATDDKAEIKAHGQFLNDLAALARRGRSAGLKMIITAQDPTDDQVPTRVRSNCQMVLAFRTPIDSHATMLMGELDAENDPRSLPQGHARIRHDSGLFQTVQFPLAINGAAS